MPALHPRRRWNGKAELPQARKANNIRVLRTRAKSQLEFDDTAGAPKITVSTNCGHRVVLDDGATELTIQHSSGAVIRMTAAGRSGSSDADRRREGDRST